MRLYQITRTSLGPIKKFNIKFQMAKYKWSIFEDSFAKKLRRFLIECGFTKDEIYNGQK